MKVVKKLGKDPGTVAVVRVPENIYLKDRWD
jgi:hypothetical protein